MSKQFWDDRYSKEAYAYGESPNAFLVRHLPSIATGKILFPAEGEGRNAVYAASLGWETSAFDISTAGKVKADILAQKFGVQLHYELNNVLDFHYGTDLFDAVALIYAHFTPDVKIQFHRNVQGCIRNGGYILLEAFSQRNLEFQQTNPYIGGPSDPEMLYTVEEVEDAFPLFEAIYLQEETIELHEGLYHNGIGSVIRYLGRKK